MDCWNELKEVLRIQTRAEVAKILTDLHKMKIKHRIISEFEKADHRYWKLINYALT
jgi:hypothetical protein